MEPLRLTYGIEGFQEIQNFLRENRKEGYTLSLYDMMTQTTAEIECTVGEILPIIMQVTNMEKDFPAWIGINELTESYVVGLNFTRGRLHTLSSYKYIDGNLEEID
jgi:hypothetical protein